jgi:hypothetical protein
MSDAQSGGKRPPGHQGREAKFFYICSSMNSICNIAVMLCDLALHLGLTRRTHARTSTALSLEVLGTSHVLAAGTDHPNAYGENIRIVMRSGRGSVIDSLVRWLLSMLTPELQTRGVAQHFTCSVVTDGRHLAMCWIAGTFTQHRFGSVVWQGVPRRSNVTLQDRLGRLGQTKTKGSATRPLHFAAATHMEAKQNIHVR